TPSRDTLSTRPPVNSQLTSASPARSLSLPTTIWPPTPKPSGGRSSRVGLPRSTGSVFGHFSSGGPSPESSPAMETWSSRSGSSPLSIHPKTSTRVLSVRASARLLNRFAFIPPFPFHLIFLIV
ncbi:hypothetical protein LINGRAHAP2_LOCUS36809, partial [Linum grandiflorum]